MITFTVMKSRVLNYLYGMCVNAHTDSGKSLNQRSWDKSRDTLSVYFPEFLCERASGLIGFIFSTQNKFWFGGEMCIKKDSWPFKNKNNSHDQYAKYIT